MLESHKEPTEGGHVHFQAGQFYIIEDPLRAQLIEQKKAVPESEHSPAQIEEAERTRLAELLKVPAAPEVKPLTAELSRVLEVPPAPQDQPIEVING